MDHVIIKIIPFINLRLSRVLFMRKKLLYSKRILYFIIIFAAALFAVILMQGWQRPVAEQPQLQPQIVQLQAAVPAQDGADVLYRQVMQEYHWSQPVCAISAKRTSFSVYWDDALLYSFTPGTYDHGGMVHWVLLPDTALSGHVLTVSSPSEELRVQIGNYSDLLLHYRNANIPSLAFSTLFLLLGVFIGLLSMGAKLAIGAQRLWTLRYLSALVLLVGLWVAMDAAVLQMFTGRGAIMYILALYSFMAMPFFLIQFYRSLIAKDSGRLRLLSRLHLLNLCISGLLQALGLVQLYQLLPLTHVLMIVTLLSLLRYLIAQLHSEFGWEARVMLTGFGMLGGCSIAGFLDYYLWKKMLYLAFLSVGMMLFVASLLAVSIGYVYREMIKSSRLQYYQKLANTDMMTRLDSRTAFEQRVRETPVLKGTCACLVMDINNLKQANDTMGHLAGDELICDAAECVLSVFEPAGGCYRMGGDEFMVLLQDVSEARVNSMLAELDLSINRKNLTRPFPLSMAVGYAMGQDSSIEQIFREADASMYRRKREMKGQA